MSEETYPQYLGLPRTPIPADVRTASLEVAIDPPRLRGAQGDVSAPSGGACILFVIVAPRTIASGVVVSRLSVAGTALPPGLLEQVVRVGIAPAQRRLRPQLVLLPGERFRIEFEVTAGVDDDEPGSTTSLDDLAEADFDYNDPVEYHARREKEILAALQIMYLPPGHALVASAREARLLMRDDSPEAFGESDLGALCACGSGQLAIACCRSASR